MRGRLDPFRWRVVNCLLLLSCWVSLGDLSGQTREKLSRSLRTNGTETLDSISELRAGIRGVSVTILNDKDVVALGTVVRSDGIVVTKASELGWQTSVRLADGKEVAPKSVFVNEENDIAVLSIEQRFDALGEAAKAGEVPRGTILVAPSNSKGRVKMGIVSAKRRPIERVGGALGVMLGQQGAALGGVEVSRVFEDTAAAKAGVQSGDVIRSVNGKVTLLRQQVQEEIASYHPGEHVALRLQRGGKTVALDVILGFRSTYFGQEDRNQRLSGVTSTRLSGFELILQHDIPVDVDAMGGPVVDLTGRLIGINIARADRVSTYALPISLVNSIVDKVQ